MRANALRVAEAVMRLQHQNEPEAKPGADVGAQVAALEKPGRHLADGFRRIGKDRTDEIGRQWARSAIRELCPTAGEGGNGEIGVPGAADMT